MKSGSLLSLLKTIKGEEVVANNTTIVNKKSGPVLKMSHGRGTMAYGLLRMKSWKLYKGLEAGMEPAKRFGGAAGTPGKNLWPPTCSPSLMG